MIKLSKKALIIIAASIVLFIGLIVTATVLITKTDAPKTFNGTSVAVLSKREEMDDSIILWNSKTKTHELTTPSSKIKCAIFINGETHEYEDCESGWIAATTTYKNQGDLEFVLYDDWNANAKGILGTDPDTTYDSFNENGSIVISGWKSKLTINLNNYSINHLLLVLSSEYGAVMYLSDNDSVTIKNGCITGGASNNDGGGIWIGGDTTNTTLDNLTITGNFSGASGGGIFIDDDIVSIAIKNCTIVGNYAVGYGGGIYMDYERGFFTNSNRLDLEGNVIIQNNKGCDNRNNLTLFCYDNIECAQLDEVNLSESACIYVSFSQKDTVERSIVANVHYSTDNNKYFHVDDSECQLYTMSITYGTGSIGQYTSAGKGLCLRKSGGC